VLQPAPDPAVLAAVAYLEEHHVQLHPATVAMLARISAELDVGALFERTASQHERACQELHTLGLRPFCVLIDRTQRSSVTELRSLGASIDALTARALHCRDIPLDDHYWQALSTAIDAGGYDLTHAAMALHWSYKEGCIDATAFGDTTQHLGPKLTQVVDQAGCATDEGIEAIVALYLIDRGDLVATDWVNTIRAAQRPDGGWAASPSNSVSWDHTTTLGLWALLLAAA
jgi:hypothetical protein